MGMKCYFSSMTNQLLTLVLVMVATVFSSVTASADAAAEQVLKGARYAATLQNQDLHGSIKKDGKKSPITLFLRGQDIQFHYQINGVAKRFHMKLQDERFDLFEILNGKTYKFNNKKLSERINNTDLSFEDLSMRFLYWKKSSIVGEEKVGGQKCHVVRLENPGNEGAYSIVYVWIHQKYGALMRVVGYDAGGNPLKQFQVTDLMKVGRKEYTLERMRVDSMKNNKVAGTTYLEFSKPKKAAGAQPGR